MRVHLRIVKQMFTIYRIKVTTDTLVRHRWIKYLVAFCLIAVPLTEIQHVVARLRYLNEKLVSWYYTLDC